MDIIPEAIEDAKYNAKQMGFANTHYEAGTAEEIIPRWYKEGYRADAVIVDPPRTGLGVQLIDTLLRYAPQKMVYVSCNVSTLALGPRGLDQGVWCRLHPVSGYVSPYSSDRGCCEIGQESLIK